MSETLFRISSDHKDIVSIHDALYEYNLTVGGGVRQEVTAKKIPGQLALTVTDKQTGKFYGGIAFHTTDSKGKLFVDYLFLDASQRKTGLGSRMWDEFEKWARSMDLTEIELTTNLFQAPGFYLKHGFSVVEEFPLPQPLRPDNVKYRMRKILDAGNLTNQEKVVHEF